jgi:hypothetical protein
MTAPDMGQQTMLSPLVREVYRIHPLQDSRWSDLVRRHPRSSVFHDGAWLQALRMTYGYEPIALTTSTPCDQLENAIVFSSVNSWLTGRRWVSLPFSDHCEPLVEHFDQLQGLLSDMPVWLRNERLRYIEIRPTFALTGLGTHWQSWNTYCLHQLDLQPDLNTLFKNCHKSSTQRKIARANRDGLTYQEGRSQPLIDVFYDLFLLTRRRHHAPPPPKIWFNNLAQCFGDRFKIRVACSGQKPIAAIVTLRHKDVLVYKYGASDIRFHNFGGMQFLMWKTMEEGKREAARILDLGRSAVDNAGLLTFKDRLGASRATLNYFKVSFSEDANADFTSPTSWSGKAAKGLSSLLPDRLFRWAGQRLYRHIG